MSEIKSDKPDLSISSVLYWEIFSILHGLQSAELVPFDVVQCLITVWYHSLVLGICFDSLAHNHYFKIFTETYRGLPKWWAKRPSCLYLGRHISTTAGLCHHETEPLAVCQTLLHGRRQRGIIAYKLIVSFYLLLSCLHLLVKTREIYKEDIFFC